jgi:hypothetical protein
VDSLALASLCPKFQHPLIVGSERIALGVHLFNLSESLQVGLADRYRIERELGAGGMATVYLAEESGTGARSPSRFSAPK